MKLNCERCGEILRGLNSLNDELKDKLKRKILENYSPCAKSDIDFLHESLVYALAEKDHEFIEFLIKDVFTTTLTESVNSLSNTDFERWLNGADDTLISSILSVLYFIFENGLEKLIEKDLEIFKKRVIELTNNQTNKLKKIIKEKAKSKNVKDKKEAITLVKLLNDDKLNRFIIKTLV